MNDADLGLLAETAPAKLNLALHVRGKRPDGRHEIETIFAFCIDGDRVETRASNALSLTIDGPFAAQLDGKGDNLVIRAALALADAAGVAAHFIGIRAAMYAGAIGFLFSTMWLVFSPVRTLKT